MCDVRVCVDVHVWCWSHAAAMVAMRIRQGVVFTTPLYNSDSDFDATTAGSWCQQVIEGLGGARPVSAQAQALFDALHSR